MTDHEDRHAAEDGTPRENRGRQSPADGLHAEELKTALTEYGAAYCARGEGEARMIRALAAAYEIALSRAQASIADPGTNVRGTEDQVFSWHFTSILGEFAISSHDSERSLRNRAHDSHLLVTAFPAWVDAIEAGQVDLRHVHALLKHGRVLDPEQVAEYGASVLDYAAAHTPGETNGFAERFASTVAAQAFEAAHRRARAERHVTITHDGVGMAVLNAYLPSELAEPIGQLLDRQTREIRERDRAAEAEHRLAVQQARATGAPSPEEFVADGRTSAQIRADLLAETLLCATPGESRVKATVSIVIPALTLLEGRSNGSAPALLAGTTPMSFAEARQLAGEATSFERILTDPVSGQVACVDAYQPSQGLRRFLRIRDRTCRLPGCIRLAAASEIDHTTPFSQGGETSADNLAHLCKGHHVLKHEKPWSVKNLGGGVLEWKTPLGQVVQSSPEPVTPRFVPKAKNRETTNQEDLDIPEDDPPPF